MPDKTRSYHHGDLKQAMVEAGLALVREKGPRGFTLSEAARTAGVAKSAPYRHFKDKDALIVEMAVRGCGVLERDLMAAADAVEPVREKLLAVLLAYVRFAEEHPDYFACMFQSGVDKMPYDELRAAAKADFDVVVRLAAQVESSPESVEALSIGVWTMAHGYAMLVAENAFAKVLTSPTSMATIRQLATRFLGLG